MEAEEGPEDDGPLLPWIAPDDRLWRHPSEMGLLAPRPAAAPTRAARAATSRLWTVAVVAGVVGAVLASGVGVATGSFDHQTTVVQSVTRLMSPSSMTVTTSDTSTMNPNWPAIASAVAPSIVSITTTGADGVQTGSGVLYTSAGDNSYILTASDLVGEGYIKVTFDDSETETARLVGIDRETGLGLVSVRGAQRAFPAFTTESSLQIAQPVLGIGVESSLGNLQVTPGSIGALDVAVASSDDTTTENLIDVNATADTANVGAALVDAQGAVFGIEASIDPSQSSSSGGTFAVPYDIAGHVASQMLAGEPVTHPWLGTVNSKDPSAATTSKLSLPGGVQITQVSPDSPAQQAGMGASDIITAFNGHPVLSTGALTALVSACAPGHEATVTYIHDGRPRSATVTMANAPSDVDLGAAAGG